MTETKNGLVGLGHRIINGLPPNLLFLIVVNVCFVGGLFWFLDKRDTARERMITPILAECLHSELNRPSPNP